MSLFNIDIIEQPSFIVDIETSTLDSLPNIVVELTRESSIILISDLPDNIPFTKIKKDDLDGVDNYLSNFIDNYEIDCGSP
jgi:hypothetical protein